MIPDSSKGCHLINAEKVNELTFIWQADFPSFFFFLQLSLTFFNKIHKPAELFSLELLFTKKYLHFILCLLIIVHWASNRLFFSESLNVLLTFIDLTSDVCVLVRMLPLCTSWQWVCVFSFLDYFRANPRLHRRPCLKTVCWKTLNLTRSFWEKKVLQRVRCIYYVWQKRYCWLLSIKYRILCIYSSD